MQIQDNKEARSVQILLLTWMALHATAGLETSTVSGISVLTDGPAAAAAVNDTASWVDRRARVEWNDSPVTSWPHSRNLKRNLEVTENSHREYTYKLPLM